MRIYPTADRLPENLLRLYVCFSAPMRQGEALRAVRLIEEEEREVRGAFLDTREELWDRRGIRMTLLFDPGRVKRGLAAHDRLGRALRPGRSYRLLIDGAWRDARGAALAAAYEKRFTVTPAAMEGLTMAQWRLEVPAAGTREPLRVRFPAPLDYVRAFHDDAPSCQLPLGEAQEWRLSAKAANHPFHIHVNPFEVLREEGPPVWKDTFLVRSDGDTQVIRTRYQRFTGTFVLHCHILDHEDQGMMQLVRVMASPPAIGAAGSGCVPCEERQRSLPLRRPR